MPLNSDFWSLFDTWGAYHLHKPDPGGNPLHENETKKFDVL